MSTGTCQPACVPTWRGRIETTKDALIIIEACSRGLLLQCSRRPHYGERKSLIVSGNVFVYEEVTSRIKRWTDGISWSPSRILTNFLIYRQLDSPLPPGEKKRATKRTQRPSRPGEPYSTPTSTSNTPTVDDHKPFPTQPQESLCAGKDDQSPDTYSNRRLVGSLVDSYEFKEGGMLKKTTTGTFRNRQYRLISYYSLEDAKHNLRTPRDDPHLKDITISQELLNQTEFKFPNLDDAGDGTFENQDQYQYGGYYHQGGAHYYPYSCGTIMGYGNPTAHAPSYPPPAGFGILPPPISMAPSATGQYGQYLDDWYYSPQQAIR